MEQPFDVGDIVEMQPDPNDYAFAIKPGTRCRVLKVNFPDSLREWCLTIQPEFASSGSRNYRASRFKLIEKGKNMQPCYVIFDTDTADGTLPPTIIASSVQLFTGTRVEVEEAVRGLLKVNPGSTYAFGRIDTLAKVDAPPVHFTKL